MKQKVIYNIFYSMEAQLSIDPDFVNLDVAEEN